MATAQPSPAQEDAGSTASRLLDTAEQLFASKGIENVSIRQIVIASGHGNLSGAHYHFGSREALIRQLLARRMVVVDAMRHAMLDRVVAEGKDGDLHAVVAAGVNTCAAVVREHLWGRDYVLIISQAMFHPRIRLRESLDPELLSGHFRNVEMVRRLLPKLPRRAFDERIEIFFHETVYAVARWLNEHGGLTKANDAGLKALTANVTVFMTAGLRAPLVRSA